MGRNVKNWGISCGVSIAIILAPLWATLIAIVLGTSVPWLIHLITQVDKYISVFGVFLFIISIYQFSKLIAKKREVKEEHESIYSKYD